MASRGRKALIIVLLVVVGLPALLVGGMRLGRHRASGPFPVAGGVLRVRNLFTEIYGARVGDRVVLFDAGVDPEGDALDVLLGALGADRDAVSEIFLSHGHFDHVAAAPVCKRARIHVGLADVEMMAQRVQARPTAARWFSRVLPIGPVEATDPFRAGQAFDLGGERALAIPFPGHTPGSYMMLFRGVLFAGDSLQIDGDHLEFAMPRFSADMAVNRRSVAQLRGALGGEKVDVVCTGHQGCTPPGQAARMLEALIARAQAAREP